MKWVRYGSEDDPRFGILRGDEVLATDQDWEGLLEGREAEQGESIDFQQVELLLPVPRPGKIVAVGQNYLDHCREQGKEPPEKPLLFAKLSSAAIPGRKPISWSESLSREVDFEAELAVVIGKTCRKVSRREALDFVLGYTVANDVSARDLQYGDKQWTRGKGLDTFCPLGPVLTPTTDIPDPQNLAIRCWLNGELMQDSHTGEMIFPVADLIAYCSQAFTLFPGDVLLTGTPHGVGVWRKPPIFLKDGDRVSIEIEGIGTLENPCEVR